MVVAALHNNVLLGNIVYSALHNVLYVPSACYCCSCLLHVCGNFAFIALGTDINQGCANQHSSRTSKSFEYTRERKGCVSDY
jgi:hypothetical protein